MYSCGRRTSGTRSCGGLPEHGGDEVDGVSAARGEDDFLGAGSVEMGGDGLAGGFVSGGGDLGEVVGAPVDVGVVFLVIAARGVEDAGGSSFPRIC